MELITTASGKVINPIGLGTFPLQGEEVAEIVSNAFKTGFRLIDTADDYWGEPGIGMTISNLDTLGLSREDVFLQSKISDNNAYANEPQRGKYFNMQHSVMHRHTIEEIVNAKVSQSLYSLKTSYLDSLLIHFPYSECYVDIWKAMIKLRDQGIVRYIGVSNFHQKHIEKLMELTGVAPSFNQIYISPISTKEHDIEYCKKIGCIPMTYSPLMDVTNKRIAETAFDQMRCKYNKSLAQIIIRWNIERGCIPIVKTKNRRRLLENYDVFDFSLSNNEILDISSSNQDYQYLLESQMCPGI